VANRYFCANQKLLESAIDKFGHDQLIAYLHALGILTYSTADGWVYPVSNSASNVVDIFTAHLNGSGVCISENTMIEDIQIRETHFELVTKGKGRSINVDRLIVASGSKALPNSGSKGEMFSVLGKLGHTIKPVKPALAPVLTDRRIFHKLQGIRVDVGVSLWIGDEKKSETAGNIIFTNWGLNGPGVMDLSHLINLNEDSEIRLKINFLISHEEALRDLLGKNRKLELPIQVLFESVLHKKIARFFLDRFQVKPGRSIESVEDETLEALFEEMTGIFVEVKGTRGFEFSQLSTGGIPLSDVDPNTMESRLVKGLYFAGEVLDVIGPCGGYNLQWAFTSGAIAGASAGNPDR
jgi:predicted Rossmann fold flavoprotein